MCAEQINYQAMEYEDAEVHLDSLPIEHKKALQTALAEGVLGWVRHVHCVACKVKFCEVRYTSHNRI